jgi:hypothetical protein
MIRTSASRGEREIVQETIMRERSIRWQVWFAAVLLAGACVDVAGGQTLEKMRLGYSGTGINNYVLELGRRARIFRRNGLD